MSYKPKGSLRIGAALQATKLTQNKRDDSKDDDDQKPLSKKKRKVAKALMNLTQTGAF